MTITPKIRERFCKDCKIPVKIFEEPYFSQRIEILDSVYDSKQKWNKFLTCLEKYNSEQEYFEDYNRVKQSMIDYIKASEGYEKFNAEDMNQYANTLKEFNLPKNISSDIYKESNVGGFFISLDIKKANFTALKHYGGIFDAFDEYEDFVRTFTNNPHFVESKYIREVIFGNCNPRRQITYERYLVDKFLKFLFNDLADIIPDNSSFTECICFVSNDEIILKPNKYFDYSLISKLAEEFKVLEGVEFKIEFFKLIKVTGDVQCYIKDIYAPENKLEFKCCNSFDIHCIIKRLQNKEITDDDLAFIHDGKLAKYLDAPEVRLEV